MTASKGISARSKTERESDALLGMTLHSAVSISILKMSIKSCPFFSMSALSVYIGGLESGVVTSPNPYRKKCARDLYASTGATCGPHSSTERS